MTPTERAVSEGHFFDPAQTTLREFLDAEPLVPDRPLTRVFARQRRSSRRNPITRDGCRRCVKRSLKI